MSHQDKYGADAFFSFVALTGWRYWRVRTRRWWHLQRRPRVWLSSPSYNLVWAPSEIQVAKCYTHSFSGTWRTSGITAVGIVVFGTLGIMLLLLLIATGLTLFGNEGVFQDIFGVFEVWAVVASVCGLLAFILAAVHLQPMLTEFQSRRNPDIKHVAPARGCQCGLYAAHAPQTLFNEFTVLNQALVGNGKKIFVVGQARTALHTDRALEGSLGFRATSMEIAPGPLFLLNGNDEIAAELSLLYKTAVVQDVPPTN